MGRVGADTWGQRVLSELRAEDLTVVGVADPDAPTALMTKERSTPRCGIPQWPASWLAFAVVCP
ncbi:hypothetical protein ACPPVO_54290 [Dactylosporangium sp. McL0621]|uniref:hypothetical protein n=1 Tax=Dactylosporangium sp. McL0621 TaxID=3415678 RepID=UPI003CECCB61